MPSMSEFTHSNGCYGLTVVAVYTGTDRVLEGEPFALKPASGCFAVDRPKAATDLFAGVAAKTYPADTGSRQIELYIPGSRGVKVRIGETVADGNTGVCGYNASTGGKKFKKDSTAKAITAYGPGVCVFREAVTYSAGDPKTHIARADLPASAYVAPVSV